MERNLFEALPAGRKTRLVYVAGNSYYGETGAGASLDETMTPRPTGFGPYITAAVDAVERLADAGREVVVAFPGAVYGNGSWFKQYFPDPIAVNKPVMRVSGPHHWVSPAASTPSASALGIFWVRLELRGEPRRLLT